MKTLERTKNFSSKAIVDKMKEDINKNYSTYSQDLAEKARAELGYDRLYFSNRGNANEKAKKEASIEKASESLGKLDKMIADGRIRAPFIFSSVEKYKNRMIKKDRAGIFLRNKKIAIISGITLSIISFTTVVALAGYSKLDSNQCFAALWAACSVISAVIFGLLGVGLNDTRYINPEWTAVDIGNAKIDIPEYVIQTAIDIKQEIPNCEFLVEIFESGYTQYVPRVSDDPFLVLVIEGMSLYMEVWNEPNFKAKRNEE